MNRNGEIRIQTSLEGRPFEAWVNSLCSAMDQNGEFGQGEIPHTAGWIETVKLGAEHLSRAGHLRHGKIHHAARWIGTVNLGRVKFTAQAQEDSPRLGKPFVVFPRDVHTSLNNVLW